MAATKRKMEGGVEDEEEALRRRTKYYCRPYRRPTPGRQERGWLETSVRLGVRVPLFCLRKAVTKSDADKAQHRYQLTDNDVKKSKVLFKMAARAASNNVAPLTVNVLDRLGRKYKMDFKYLSCNGYFRFMGNGWTEFLGKTQLKEKQMMTIWALPGVKGSSKEKEEEEEEEEYWFAFLNNDAEEEDTFLI